MTYRPPKYMASQNGLTYDVVLSASTERFSCCCKSFPKTRSNSAASRAASAWLSVESSGLSCSKYREIVSSSGGSGSGGGRIVDQSYFRCGADAKCRRTAASRRVQPQCMITDYGAVLFYRLAL
eukprot:m.146454 g.146454  ORF g.146454 m.146454 type:complete len:124 (-) comp14145_c0_seq2:86-457(-)